MSIRRWLAIVACLFATPAIGQPSQDDGRACVERAQKAFSELVERFVRTSVANPKYGIGKNDYLQAPKPKAVALCINWERATPETTFGFGWGFASARTAPDPAVVKSVALSNCGRATDAREGRCTCEIVHVDGVLALQFPRRDWSGGRCK